MQFEDTQTQQNQPKQQTTQQTTQNNTAQVDLSGNKPETYSLFYMVFHLVITIFAIKLAIQCNKGFDLGAIFMAVVFPIIYIPYRYLKHAFGGDDSKCDFSVSTYK